MAYRKFAVVERLCLTCVEQLSRRGILGDLNLQSGDRIEIVTEGRCECEWDADDNPHEGGYRFWRDLPHPDEIEAMMTRAALAKAEGEKDAD